MCYFCASVGYDFYIGQQFEQTTDISIGFSRTSLQKKILMKTFGVRIIEVRIIEVRIIEDVLYNSSVHGNSVELITSTVS